MLGADEAVRQAGAERHREEHRAALRQRLVERTTTAGGVDAEAAAYVREHGWARNRGE